MSQANADAVPASQKGSWASLLKAITSFSGDLYSLTAPPFILSPVSLVEYSSYWAERPAEFAAIVDGKTEEERAVLVLKWFIGSFRGHYTSRTDQMGSEKKPLNPILGELFFGSWPDVDGRGRTELTAEQVSHHPPITAFFIQNASKKISLQGHFAQRTSFSSGSIIVTQVGHAILSLVLPSGKEETYLITLPKLRIDGLWYGSPYLELVECSHVQSSTGWYCKIDYRGRGYFSGKAHTFSATLTPPNGHGAPLKFEGQWDGISRREDGTIFTDVTGPREAVQVRPLAEMGPMETRKVWAAVADGIRSGNFEVASTEKSKVENEQRRRRREEAAAGTPWQLQYFVHSTNDPVYEQLGKMFLGDCSADCYVFKQPKAPQDAGTQ